MTPDIDSLPVRRAPSRLVVAVLAAALLVPLAARAQDVHDDTSSTGVKTNIDGLKIDGITLVEGEFDLDERFDVKSSTIEDIHKVNVEDCALYNVETATDDGCTIDTSVDPTVEIEWSAASSESSRRWTAKIGSCSSSDNLLDEPTGCALLTSAQDVSSTNIIRVSLSRLIGTLDEVEINAADRVCCSSLLGTTGTIRVSIFTDEDDNERTELKSDDVEFSFDYKRPVAPTGVAIEANGETIGASWSEVTGEDKDELRYRVYYSTVQFDAAVASYADLEDIDYSSVSGAFTSTVIGDDGSESLDVGQTYYVGVAAVDGYDNISQFSSVWEVPTYPTSDGWEYYKQAGGKDEGGFAPCFVATASYGSAMHPHIGTLRVFRDRFLMTSSPGRAFVDFYYTYGPAWADAIRGSGTARAIVRVGLAPLVALAWIAVSLSLLEQILLLLLGAVLVRAARTAAARYFGVPSHAIHAGRGR
jgi:hypothetical protein